jgi:hypothetical protein
VTKLLVPWHASSVAQEFNGRYSVQERLVFFLAVITGNTWFLCAFFLLFMLLGVELRALVMLARQMLHTDFFFFLILRQRLAKLLRLASSF